MRTQILETLALTPMTVKQVAKRLGTATSRLYYHFNQLEAYGLIVVSETRMVANMMEQPLQIAASMP